MPIDTEHEAYARINARARKVRDAVQGQEAVHAAGKTYLPALTEQTVDQFNAYMGRAGWYGATGRTHDGMVGMVFRRAPVLDATGLDDITADIDLGGTSLDGQARHVLSEVLQAARVGVLVEFPVVQTDQPQTVAQAQAGNQRPYATLYPSESIINWRVERVRNAMRITMLVLREMVERTDPNDVFAQTGVEQYRALLLSDGVYVQQVWQRVETAATRTTKAGSSLELVSEFTPRMNGKPMTEIPFFVFGPTENSLAEQQPPLQQLAEVNFGHYRNTADLEHGAHFAGLPTPYVFGVQLSEGASIAIGSPTAITSPDPQCKAGFLEFTGTGLGALEKRCEVKEQQMAALGARMLAPEKSGVEAEGALAMRHTGESSVLAGMAMLVSDGMTKVLRTMAQWAAAAGDVVYKLNTDFMPTGLSAQDLTALVAAYQAGAISFETFIDNLKRGEIVNGDVDAEDEKARIDANPPMALTMAQQALDQKANEPPGGGNGDDE